jgi:tetratricopeptide (TPR) repeat protein
VSAVNERLNLLLDLGKCREAAAFAREELAREPRWGALHTHLARALVGMREVEAALAAAREGVKYAAFDAWSHDIHGFVLAQAGRYKEALAATAEALRLSPEWVGGHATRAWVENLAGRHADALATTEAGLRLAPEHWQLLKERAWSLYKLGRFDDAAAAAVAGRALHPTRPAFFNVLGCVAMSRGEKTRFDLGFRDFVEALRLNPTESTYHDNRRLNARIEGKRAAKFWGVAVVAFAVAVFVSLLALLKVKVVPPGMMLGFLALLLTTAALEKEAVMFTRPRVGATGLPPELSRRDRVLGKLYWGFVALGCAAGCAIICVTLIRQV